MDVARALADRVGHDRVHQAHDRRLLGGALEVLQVDVVLGADELDVLVADLLEDVLVAGAGLVVALDRLLQRRRRRHRYLDVVAGEELDLVDGHQVRRIGHGERQRRADEVRGDEVVLHHERLGNHVQDLARHLQRPEVDDGQPVLALEVGEEGLLGDEAQADEMRRQCAAVFALLIEGARELLGVQVAASLQEVSEPGAHGLGGRRARRLRGVRG